FGSLMIWNYRPLRYELILIYPFCAAAAIALTAAWHWAAQSNARSRISKVSWWHLLIIYPVAIIITYNITAMVVVRLGFDTFYDNLRFPVLAISALITVALYWLIPTVSAMRPKSKRLLMRSLVISAVVVSVAQGAILFGSWAVRASYSSSDVGRELSMMLSPEAILSGPFGPVLSLESGLKSVIHMFGVTDADSTLFDRFPITHLLIDQHNETRVKEDYPEMMDKALQLATFRVAGRKVRLFLVAGLTGNREAGAYPLAVFERAMVAVKRDNTPMARRLAEQYNSFYPNSMSGHLFIAQLDVMAGNWEGAENHFKKAVEFSPTSHVLNAALGEMYKKRYVESGDPADRTKGISWLEKALFYAPTANNLPAVLKQLKEMETWQPPDTTL
ncbi:MAG: hypothetical protein V3T31_09795, partial [candidate division Zixibacteria bacterium]